MSEGAGVVGAYRVLILDGNASTRNLAKVALERHLSCEVLVCPTPKALFEAVRERLPDLCLLDVALRDAGGIEVCRALKANPMTEGLPIVFLSAYKDPAQRVAALQAGGADYLDKPFYPEELVARVKHHAEMHRLGLENLDQIAEQQALLRVLCHDLVNPIFGAHSLLSLKRENGRVDERTLDLVLDCCQSAMNVIEHVRQEHRLVKDKQFRAEAVAVEEAFAEAHRVLGLQFAQKNVQLVVQVEAKVSLVINRVVLVHSILNNLLTNALKFTPAGRRVFLKSGIATEADERLCVIEVRDEGVGMPAEILAALFDEEAKVSRTGTNGENGTGFGMPLVKRYVEKSRGSVEVESREGRGSDEGAGSGTTVRLTFPLVEG